MAAFWSSQKSFDRANIKLLAVESTYKLHPLAYIDGKGSSEWLLDACLRQHSFAAEFPMEHLTFENSYKHYVEFLFICKNKKSEVVVPTKFADFMWHSHMQDNEKYCEDMFRTLKKILDHRD